MIHTGEHVDRGHISAVVRHTLANGTSSYFEIDDRVCTHLNATPEGFDFGQAMKVYFGDHKDRFEGNAFPNYKSVVMFCYALVVEGAGDSGDVVMMP